MLIDSQQLILKPIASSPNGCDDVLRAKLLTYVTQVYIDDTNFPVIIVPPHLLDDLLPAEDDTRVFCQCAEEIELDRR